MTKKKREILKCTECNPERLFKLKSTFEMHKQVCHVQLEQQKVTCKWCGMWFAHQQDMNIHQALYKHLDNVSLEEINRQYKRKSKPKDQSIPSTSTISLSNLN